MATALPHPESSRAAHFEVLRSRDEGFAKLLMAFISTGLVFMVFPGTFLGVWNLLQISGRESVASISPAWIQAHGHAQVFGWVGSFIMGIGFFSIPQLRAGVKASFGRAWTCWAMWSAGAALRWVTNVYRWEWRVMLPVSAVLELAAFLIFFRSVSQHQRQESGQKQLEPWIWVVISASIGFLLLLILNLAGCFYVAFRETTPAFTHVFDQRYLTLMAWGFLVPFVWGFSAKWMGVFLGLKPVRSRILLSAVFVNLTGIALALAGVVSVGVWFFLGASALAIAALRMFEPAINEPKTRGVHRSFPFFIRFAYVWLVVAAGLGVAAVRWDHSGGIWGASRHALTVGFISVMIVSVGQRILPAFAGMRVLWKPRLMFTALLLLTVGCTLRVGCEVLAYQEYVHSAWRVLPLSALIELAGLTAFAFNLAGTFVLQPSHAVNEPMIARISGVNV
ncbi:MAG: NnrS family protein [Acidobacteria bacterium]|nr:NnrS family protein [Acidobacteriota bacterium]MBS1864503.1 NnrS family protein [Acidobacteriota bacterium]